MNGADEEVDEFNGGQVMTGGNLGNRTISRVGSP